MCYQCVRAVGAGVEGAEVIEISINQTIFYPEIYQLKSVDHYTFSLRYTNLTKERK